MSSDDAQFFGGQYDGRLLDHAYKVREGEGGRLDVGFAFHGSLPYEVVICARRKAAPGSSASPAEAVAAFDDLFETTTSAERGRSMLIPQLRQVIVERAADPSISITRHGVIFRDVASTHRARLARLVWGVVVPIQRVVLWTEVQHPYRPRAKEVSLDEYADEVQTILEQAAGKPPVAEAPKSLDADAFEAIEDDEEADVSDDDLDTSPLAFLPPPDAEAELDTEAVETDQERTWFVRLDADTLVLACPDADVRETIALDAPFTVSLSQSRRADDSCALLHLAIRQERDDATSRIGLTSRTSDFAHPVDELPHAGASHPMIVEDAMLTLLARLRAAMQALGDERWV